MTHRDHPNRSSRPQPGVKDRSRLAALESTRLLDTPFEERFDALTRLACRLFEVPIALISLVDEQRVWFKSVNGLTIRETPVEHSFCAHSLSSDSVMVVEDARHDSRFADSPLVTGPPHIRFYAGAPIHGPDNMPLGTFCITSDRPRVLSSKERDTLKSLARLTTLEIAHRRHQPELLIPDSEEALVQSIGAVINRAEQRHIAGTPPRLVLLELLDDLLRLTECEYGLVGEIKQQEKGAYLDILGMSLGDVTSQGQKFFMHGGRRLNLERMNALVDGRLSLPEIQIFSEDDLAQIHPHDLPASHPTLRNALMVPFMNDGRGVGMLLMANRRTHFNPERARRLLKPLMNIGGSLLASLYAESEKAALHAKLEEFRATLDATLDLILIFDEQSQRFIYCNQGALEQLGYSKEELIGMPPAKLLDSLSAGELDERLAPLRNGQQRLVRLNATLRRRNNEPLPVQAVVQRIRHDDSGRTNYIIVARDLRETLEAQREIDWITHHDSLTRQLNRAGFLQALMLNAPRRDDPAPLQMVLICGIDRFKRLNDAHGTALADTILCELAQRLTLALASYPEALLGRLSGDEFAINVNIAQDSNAFLLADWLRQQVEQHRFEAVEGLQLTVSIGVAVVCCGQVTAEELLRRANAALVRAKRQGRNRVRQYLSGMLDEASRHQSIERRLSGAFARGDFTLHFQPQWALNDLSCPIGAEALLRWKDEELGAIGPDVFIPILEESGMMVEVGRWIIDQALDHLVSARDQLPEGFFVSVNVSAIQLMDDAQLADHVVSALRWRDLPTSALELEITETALIQSPHWVGQQLEALHERGVNIALDDFGTGFSSLSHLKQFPFDTVKIDKSFIAGLPDSAEDRAIIESLLTLCRGFGRDVCAEGIETPAQLDFLRRLNCARAQGYLLARPSPSLQVIAEALPPSPDESKGTHSA
ncbi:PAS domain S-box-containing protein/diguanylate cyclase (GGDEF) domain-containing protein [Modicisalibacter muralis]|uniref:PAS domain S-box-containing protein/diguanylate cyclase (GGDEF) domain-containing protein n=1 Tax=Modicisalibacter muralis TaxID=119000 RepID=A0A1G9FVX9_9GAMM|nr:EAL domain-containing protein [Halomonas muralis]SDK92502.1 PAS domain S-box-containing protein/diguanylate cyclase (GGDEF) domain-containing protein [Halomonas muralis]